MIRKLISLILISRTLTCFCQEKIPVIDVTDLYHMHQDPGDNLDLITAYALPQIDLKAVILDCSEGFRGIKAGLGSDYTDQAGPRDAGFVPVLQLNYIFDRNIPYGVAPFIQMRTPDDKMTDVPAFQQSGLELILRVLSESKQKVEIVSFGSARPVAVAYNRNPELFMQKVSHIHLSAGGGYQDHPEWNVGLDPNAIICLLKSSLPIYIYPCASFEKDPAPANYFLSAFTVDTLNTYWTLKNKTYIKEMPQPLKRYIAYALGNTARNDFLRAMEVDDSTEVILNSFYPSEQHVWETSIWCNVANLKLVNTNMGWRILPTSDLKNKKYELLKETMKPCNVSVQQNGYYTIQATDQKSNFSNYCREKPDLYEKAMNEAFPVLMKSYRIK